MPANWIQTFTGRHIQVLHPEHHRPDDIDIRDIFWSLSGINRYNAHGRRTYTVGEHTLRVVNMVPEDDKAHALFHDGSEAYIGDITRPLKVSPEFAAYRALEERWMAFIYVRFGLSTTMPASVKAADNYAIVEESRVLMNASVADWDILNGEYDWLDGLTSAGGKPCYFPVPVEEPPRHRVYQDLLDTFHELRL